MRRTHLNSRNRLRPLNIDIEDEGGEWVLENPPHGCSWQHSLEVCIELWVEYCKYDSTDFQIRNVNTGEIIPCAALQ